MEQFIRATKALSDPSRVKIVKMLEQKTLCVCEIRELLDLAQPTVSKHLKILVDAGIVVGRKDHGFVEYSLTRTPCECCAGLLDLLRGRLEKDPEIRAILNRLPFVNRQDITARQKTQGD